MLKIIMSCFDMVKFSKSKILCLAWESVRKEK